MQMPGGKQPVRSLGSGQRDAASGGDWALAAKTAIFPELGVHVHLCGI
jgi:hypothetical protein